MGQVSQRSGREGWYVVWSDRQGRRHRRRIHGTREQALEVLRALELRVDEERLGVAPALARFRQSIYALCRLAGGRPSMCRKARREGGCDGER